MFNVQAVATTACAVAYVVLTVDAAIVAAPFGSWLLLRTRWPQIIIYMARHLVTGHMYESPHPIQDRACCRRRDTERLSNAYTIETTHYTSLGRDIIMGKNREPMCDGFVLRNITGTLSRSGCHTYRTTSDDQTAISRCIDFLGTPDRSRHKCSML
jgi:hypothetical protein